MTCQRFEEEALLRLERGETLDDEHFATCPDCLAARAAYLSLQEAIREAGAGDEPPLGWQAGVWQRIEQQRQPRRWSWLPAAALASVCALAAALFLAIPRLPSLPLLPGITQQIASGTAIVRGADPHPGARLLLRAETAGAAHAELRVYRNGRDLLLRCRGVSSDSSCRREGTALRAELVFPSAGDFQAVLVLADGPLPAAGAGLDRDSGAVLEQSGRVVLGDEIPVR